MRSDGESVPGEAEAGDTAAQSRTEEAQQEFTSAAHARQREGSYSFDDPDRPRWDRDTKLVAEYDYHHPDGRYAYTKLKGLRADGKKAFLTGRRLGGNDLQIEKMEWPNEFYRYPGLTSYMKGSDDQPDLYRLPELLAAMAERPDDPVFICEGEKDADRLWAIGLIATTNPNGAGKWRPEFDRLFQGREVIILADNDQRGRDHAQQVAANVASFAAQVKIVRLPDLAVNGDVTDWLEAGHSKDDLLAAVESAEVYEAGSSAGGTDAGATHTAPGEFSLNENGVPFKTLRNALIAIDRLGVTLRYDEFASRYLIDGLPGFGPALDDAALTRMRLRVEQEWGLIFGKDRWFDIATDQARHNTFNPVRAYLDARQSEWDGQKRLDTWLTVYGGAEDNEYTRVVGAISLIAAARRARQPGCKFDEMAVLESEQGTNKSSALAILAVKEEWFTDDCPLNADSKVLIEQLGGRWIIEMGELKGMRRGEVEHVKSMLSRRVDKARLAYGRMPVEQPRQCVFFGTTNDSAYLRDMTGNRRFWPVKVQRFDLNGLRADRDQLWAEAAVREAKGASIRLPEHLWAVAGEHQAAREVMDPIFETLAERLEGWKGKVRASDIWETIGLGDPSRRTPDHNVRLSAAMQKLGWRRPKSVLRFDGKPQRAWVKGEDGLKADAYPEVPSHVLRGPM
jgi:5S rRNA maturation endonuclease (ribonuclease M5)